MKRFTLPLCFIAVVSLLTGSSILFQDNLRAGVSKGNCNIVLITIDALRADHLSCYGYHRKTTPYIDEIAKSSILFTNAIAPSSWTAPSMASLFTSLYPTNHGVTHGFFKEGKVFKQEVFSKRITTLTEILKKHGYTTFGIAANLHLNPDLGFARGFDYYSCPGFEESGVVNKIVLSWKDKIKNSSKYFLWIHYIDPHWFYFAREPWIKEYDPNFKGMPKWTSRLPLEIIQNALEIKQNTPIFNSLIALYDSEINYVDHNLKILIDQLQLLNNSILIITSDHGEDFLEHKTLGHGKTLYAESINIPLIIRIPQKMNKKVINRQVSLLDLMPTILSFLEISYSKNMLGLPLLTPNGEEKKITDRFLFTELEKGDNKAKSVLTGDWQYISNYKEKREELYNRRQDPKECINLAGERPSLAKNLKDQLSQWMNSTHKYPTKKIKIIPSPEMKEKLESLGYISNNKQGKD